ncbi:hypothetical protein HDE68_004919 [Pedobacter cryoconitis]|uniref:3-keto-alpha-glucoside-1,2-lyase/3-keto-2-hydroxy-glucal hydratase domain-containing protein n=1 Tax=Pedobacter cryoconitis TaxID=188932 RepID=A0A7W8ZRQ4_9SPHI|nr:DUF1080 domain-containing protein [Pedobacter cryoconitis]MBB5638981.1 hypothetical protein [Pedobacter cryoconitis]
MKKVTGLIVVAGLTAAVISSCSSPKPKDNELSSEEKAQGYQLLFDGKTLNGWHLYNQGNISSAWVAQNGELICLPGTDATHGDLVTDQDFENYEFSFDWKISKEGNSGVFINVVERADIPTAWASGPEYQLLEKGHHDYEKEMKRSGCLYNFSPQLNPAELKPLNEWNHSVIRQQDGKIEFILNGIVTAKENLNSIHWKEAVANTNFKNFPEFGKHLKGRIALQDWNKGISFKNIKIRKLAKAEVHS